MDTTTIILLTITILCFLCGFYFLFRIELCKEYNFDIVIPANAGISQDSTQPSVKKVDSCIRRNDKKEYPKVSVIIPARNEEHNIGKLLSSINNQNVGVHCNEPLPKHEPLQTHEPVIEVIVVNDGSTDKTKEIALGYDSIVIDSKPLPVGWMGKPWACWQGAESATGDILIFLDADTIIEPNGLKKIVDSYLFESQSSNHGKGLALSIAPYHKIEKLYEEFSAIFNIIMVGSMNAFTPFKSIKPTGLFGQSLIVSRKHYFEIGGHSSVKNKILENVFMARKFKDAGVNLKCLGGKGTLSFRMYPDGFKALVNGWTKAFAAGAGQTPFFTLLLIILWLSSGFIIIIKLKLEFLSGNPIIIWLSLYFTFVLQIYWMLRRIGTFRFISSLLFPANLLFYVIVFFRSLYYQISKKSISWKSREVSN